MLSRTYIIWLFCLAFALFVLDAATHRLLAAPAGIIADFGFDDILDIIIALVVGGAVSGGAYLALQEQYEKDPAKLAAQLKKLARSALPPNAAAKALQSDPAKADDVDVTVFAPPQARPLQKICIQVLLHTPTQEQSAGQKATSLDPDAERLASVPLTVRLRSGDRVSIAIDRAEAIVAEPIRELVWTGQMAHCPFFITPVIGVVDKYIRPRIFVRVNGIPAGHVVFKIFVKVSAPATAPVPVSEEAKRYRKAFLSYASEDRVQVLRSAQLLSSIGMEFFQDLLTLTPGQRWEQKLYEDIDSCDLFLLFWSRHAAQSEWVIKEAEYALSHANEPNQLQLRPVILEGPPPVPPPPSLSKIHFNDPIQYIIFAEDAARTPAPAGSRWAGAVLVALLITVLVGIIVLTILSG
jgi:hypothetical protein